MMMFSLMLGGSLYGVPQSCKILDVDDFESAKHEKMDHFSLFYPISLFG